MSEKKKFRIWIVPATMLALLALLFLAEVITPYPIVGMGWILWPFYLFATILIWGILAAVEGWNEGNRNKQEPSAADKKKSVIKLVILIIVTVLVYWFLFTLL